MKILIALMSVFLGSVALAAKNGVTSYTTASCEMYQNDVSLLKQDGIQMKTIIIDDHLSRFVQLVAETKNDKIGYQLLIEDDTMAATVDTVLVLQNLKVNDKEISSEFSARDVGSVNFTDGVYSVKCTLPRAL